MSQSRSAALAALTAIMFFGVEAQADSPLGSNAEVPDYLSVLKDIVFSDLNAGPTYSHMARPDTFRGWNGSAAIVAYATNGDVDEFYSGIEGRFSHFDGSNSHDIFLGFAYDEDGGMVATNTGTLSYQYRHSISARAFSFTLFEGRYNEFGIYESDTRLVAGAGLRLFDTTRTSLSIMAGPGYRYAERSDGRDFDEAGVSVGTRGHFALSDNVYASTANTVMVSDSDTAFTSDLSLNFALSKPWALRTGFQKEYHSNPVLGRDDTVNLLSASLVYTFK